MKQADRELMDYVQAIIRTGAIEITLSSLLLENASAEAIKEVRALCKINGVTIKGVWVD